MHFTRLGTYGDQHEVPVMVRGEGAYVWDQHGKRYLDGLAGLFTSQIGHGRTELAEAASKQASELAYFPLWTYAHPRAIELADRIADLTPGDLNRVFFTTGGSEAVESAWKLARQYFRVIGRAGPLQGHQPGHRLPRHHHGGAVDHRDPRHSRRPSSRSCPGRSRWPTPISTGRPYFADDLEAFGRWAADEIARTIESKGPTRWPPSTSSRCRTPEAASRRLPATSPGCARSATATACCSSPTR